MTLPIDFLLKKMSQYQIFQKIIHDQVFIDLKYIIT
jgi:hypothetical protein